MLITRRKEKAISSTPIADIIFLFGELEKMFLVIYNEIYCYLEAATSRVYIQVTFGLKIDDIVKNSLSRWSGFLTNWFTTLCSGWSLDWIWKMKAMLWTCYWHSSIICNSYSYHSFLSLLVVFPKHVLGMSFLD